MSLPAEPDALAVGGGRVRVETVREQDLVSYRLAVEQSRQRLARWNPVDPDDLARHRSLQSRDYRTFLIHALRPEGDHDLVGKINIVNAVRGRFESAAMGYDAYDPYAGRGLFAEGLRLVLGLAFKPEPEGGMGLHRIAATVQPGNVRSAGLLRSVGFAREGFSPRMLWLPDANGVNAWRDQDSYALLREEWPARPYPRPAARRIVALVNGAAGSGTTAVGRELAAELGIPLFARNVAGSGRGLWALLADSPVGGVVEGWFGPDDAPLVVEGLRSCGLDPGAVPEVWCHPVQVGGSVQPLGLGPTVAVDTGQAMSRGEVVRIALQVGGALRG